MRSFLTWPMALAAVLFGGLALQQAQLGHLRGQLAQQAVSLEESQQHISALTGQLAEAEATRAAARNQFLRPGAESAFWREDERRLMLSGYADFLAQAHLSPGGMARLKDLLVERAEALADARDAAGQEGIADGSAEMARATGLATADLDREIAGLLGPASGWRDPGITPVPDQNAYAAAAPPSPTYVEAAPAAPTYVYLPAAAPSMAEAPVAESPVVDYVPVSGVLYVVRRAGRFPERSGEGRRFAGQPRPSEGRPPFERPGTRSSVRTAPVR